MRVLTVYLLHLRNLSGKAFNDFLFDSVCVLTEQVWFRLVSQDWAVIGARRMAKDVELHSGAGSKLGICASKSWGRGASIELGRS